MKRELMEPAGARFTYACSDTISEKPASAAINRVVRKAPERLGVARQVQSSARRRVWLGRSAS